MREAIKHARRQTRPKRMPWSVEFSLSLPVKPEETQKLLTPPGPQSPRLCSFPPDNSLYRAIVTITVTSDSDVGENDPSARLSLSPVLIIECLIFMMLDHPIKFLAAPSSIPKSSFVKRVAPENKDDFCSGVALSFLKFRNISPEAVGLISPN